MQKRTLFISLDGVLIQRNEKKFSLQKEIEIIQELLSTSNQSHPQQQEQSKQFPQFKEAPKFLSKAFDIEYYLSREARIQQPKHPELQSDLSHLQQVFINQAFQDMADYSLVPKVKNTLKNLGSSYKRILIVQSVWHDRMNKIFNKFKDDFNDLIDAYLFVSAQKGALIDSVKNFMKQQELHQEEENQIFVSNSLTQILEMRAYNESIKTILFNRNLSSQNVLESVIKEHQINQCIYDFSSMTMINLQGLIKNVIETTKRENFDKLLRVGLLYTRHKNTKAKWDKVNTQNYLLNDEKIIVSYIDIFLPLKCQETVDLMIQKLPIHFTPYDLKNNQPEIIIQKTNELKSIVKFYQEPDLINIVSGRSYFKQKLDKILCEQQKQMKLENSNMQLKNPKWFLLSQELDPFLNSDEFLKQISIGIKQNQISYPIIIQSDNATTHPSSHNLAIIKSEAGLQKFIEKKYFQLPRDGPNLIIQQFIEHNSSIIKIYMLQQNTFFGARIDQSISVMKMKDDQVFYLGQSEKELGFGDKLLEEDKQDISKNLHKLLGKVVNEFGIKIVGFDIIRKVGSQDYYIIDINHFPSFGNLPEFPNKFKDVLVKYAQKEHDARTIQSQLD